MTQLSNDELLLNHLNLLVEGLELMELEIIEMLEEHPDLAESSAIEVLHQALDSSDLITSE